MAEQGTSSLNAESSMPPKQRKAITLNAYGLPVGDYSTKLSSRCGQLVRTLVPILYKDWCVVPNDKKDELWKLHLHRMPSESQASATLPLKNQESVVVSNTIGNHQSPLTLRQCKMMSWRQEVVTLGRAYIGNGLQQIHCNSLPACYYKVSVYVIEKGDVELPYPNGFHSTFGEVGYG